MEELPADGVSAPLPGRCRFYVAKKKRFCKMIVGRGKTLCGEHADGLHASGDSQQCPLRFPGHRVPPSTVFEDSLAKHLKKCNSREKPKPVSLFAIPVFMSYFLSLCLFPKASLLGNMNTLGLLGADRCFIEFGAGKGKLSHWMHVAMQECHNVHFLLVERSSTRFKVDGKHRSADSIFERLQVDIQHLSLRRVPFLREKKLPIVGVGKHLCGAATDLALRCLLESSGKETSEGPDQPPKKRARQDCEAEAPPTALGTADVEWEPVVSGLAVALCCHHRCEWRHYVGKEFFQERGLGAVEFAAYQRMSSWATCGLRRANNSKGHYPEEETEECEKEEAIVPNSLEEGVSAEEREHVGRLCKVLIDYGRVHFLRRHGFTSHLHHYTSRDVSLENVLLTAVPTTTAS
ncbi:tRNA:m(4)X modification enzyme TRM13-like [Scleropages formosus]|uniref:tRNA:m(4)X modification enzyme TRM13 n=1 Tax=Scleropages formosus TaxID=113540 RepID=A0A0P7ZDX1_SCLFO|nr:tRNA:m(4)X modification enzyme TRM13-like [Scleropages formosus]